MPEKFDGSNPPAAPQPPAASAGSASSGVTPPVSSVVAAEDAAAAQPPATKIAHQEATIDGGDICEPPVQGAQGEKADEKAIAACSEEALQLLHNFHLDNEHYIHAFVRRQGSDSEGEEDGEAAGTARTDEAIAAELLTGLKKVEVVAGRAALLSIINHQLRVRTWGGGRRQQVMHEFWGEGLGLRGWRT